MEVPDKKGQNSMPGTAWLRRISAVSRMTGAAGGVSGRAYKMNRREVIYGKLF